MNGLEFHHVGVVCSDLDQEAKRLAMLGYKIESPDFYDPVQGVRGRFLTGGGPRLELLCSAQKEGVLAPWIKAGAKLYHLAYLTSDIARSIEAMKQERARVMVAPVPAVAFDMNSIAFLMMPNMLLIELISRRQ